VTTRIAVELDRKRKAFTGWALPARLKRNLPRSKANLAIAYAHLRCGIARFCGDVFTNREVGSEALGKSIPERGPKNTALGAPTAEQAANGIEVD
jgi:hypothetical protein